MLVCPEWPPVIFATPATYAYAHGRTHMHNTPPPHTHTDALQIWDVTKLRCTRTMGGHRQRVGTQAWASATLASGSRDKSVLLRDVRVPAHYSGRLTGHKSEVCGLKVR